MLGYSSEAEKRNALFSDSCPFVRRTSTERDEVGELHSSHANLPSCSRTTESSRADSSSAAVSSFVSRSIF